VKWRAQWELSLVTGNLLVDEEGRALGGERKTRILTEGGGISFSEEKFLFC